MGVDEVREYFQSCGRSEEGWSGECIGNRGTFHEHLWKSFGTPRTNVLTLSLPKLCLSQKLGRELWDLPTRFGDGSANIDTIYRYSSNSLNRLRLTKFGRPKFYQIPKRIVNSHVSLSSPQKNCSISSNFRLYFAYFKRYRCRYWKIFFHLMSILLICCFWITKWYTCVIEKLVTYQHQRNHLFVQSARRDPNQRRVKSNLALSKNFYFWFLKIFNTENGWSYRINMCIKNQLNPSIKIFFTTNIIFILKYYMTMCRCSMRRGIEAQKWRKFNDFIICDAQNKRI